MQSHKDMRVSWWKQCLKHRHPLIIFAAFAVIITYELVKGWDMHAWTCYLQYNPQRLSIRIVFSWMGSYGTGSLRNYVWKGILQKMLYAFISYLSSNRLYKTGGIKERELRVGGVECNYQYHTPPQLRAWRLRIQRRGRAWLIMCHKSHLNCLVVQVCTRHALAKEKNMHAE